MTGPRSTVGEPRTARDAPLRIRYLSAEHVSRWLPRRHDLLAVVERVLLAQGRGEVVLEPRVHLQPRSGSVGHFNVLRAHLNDADTSGIKVVGDFVDNYRLGLPSEMALITLFDSGTGAPKAILDGTEITSARTGALTALGARHLARPGSRVLGHVGARGTAWWNVVLLDLEFDFDEIRVTSRREESRELFAAELSASLGKAVRAVATPEECWEGADILVEATRLREPTPLLRAELVRPGCLLIPYGTVSALALNILDVVDKVVVDDWSQATVGPFGALRTQIDSGQLTRENVHAELGSIVAGMVPGREADNETILFWHRGLATTDVAVALAVFEAAMAAGGGIELPYR